MSDNNSPSDRDRIVVTLRELIEALDRRVPHVERLGEVRIAREAATLRNEAARRLQELCGEEPEGAARDGEHHGTRP